MSRLLLVDDDLELSSMLAEYLASEGYEVEAVYDGLAAVKAIKAVNYDAVVLDVMMPELDGFGVLKQVRSYSEVPVLMLTAKGDDVDRIVGLEMGADDYLAKPFNPRELLARIRAILRRRQIEPQNAPDELQIEVGGLLLDKTSRTARANDAEVSLTSTEFNILYLMMQHLGEVVSKARISEEGMGKPLEKYDRSVDMHMSHLRKKLLHDALRLSIATVHGQGYQLVDHV